VIAPLIAALKLASPLYTAVMVWLPATSEEVLRVATPLDKVPWPSGVVPSRKLTVPVGVAAVENTVAVKRRELVRTTELVLLVRITVTEALLTTTVAALLLATYCPSLPE
jgi:hypothetical protein